MEKAVHSDVDAPDQKVRLTHEPLELQPQSSSIITGNP